MKFSKCLIIEDIIRIAQDTIRLIAKLRNNLPLNFVKVYNLF